MVLNLNRLLCVHYDLPLGYGLYKERPVSTLCDSVPGSPNRFGVASTSLLGNALYWPGRTRSLKIKMPRYLFIHACLCGYWRRASSDN